jgi:hypothetical protein
MVLIGVSSIRRDVLARGSRAGDNHQYGAAIRTVLGK